ncbi:YJR003C-like protein [Saccharomyces cerevisiae FostersO]|nr:YJR003C-like protein [Saccharomyces cerevisiae FostersO]
MTQYQICELYDFYSLDNIVADPLVLHKCLTVLGENEKIQQTEEEKEIISKLEEEIDIVKSQCHDNWSLEFPNWSVRKTATSFEELFLEIQKRNIDKKDFELAHKLLRLIGAFKGKVSLFFKLYDEYLLKFKNK